MTMTSSGARDIVDLTQDEEDCDEIVARVGCRDGLGAAGQQAAEAAQVLCSSASHAHVRPRRPAKLQWAQHHPEGHIQQATSTQQQQQQQAHVYKGPLAQYQAPCQPRVPAPNLTDPALHLLDHTFMMDALSVLTYSQAAAQRSDQPGFASLDVQCMQLLSPAQAVNQGRLLVFLEWLTVQMCQRGLLTEHMALANYVLLSCQAAKGGVLISIMALASVAAHTAPGYIQEFVRVTQGRQSEYEALAMFPWLQPNQAGGNFTIMQYLVAVSFFELRPIWQQQQQQAMQATNPFTCGYIAEGQLQLWQQLTGQLQRQQQQQQQGQQQQQQGLQQQQSQQQQPSHHQVVRHHADMNRLQLQGRTTLHQAATHTSIGQQPAPKATSQNWHGISLPHSPDPACALHGFGQPVAPACSMPQSSRRHDTMLATLPVPLMHAAVHGAGAGPGSQVLSSSPSGLGEMSPLVAKGKAVVVPRKDAADNLPFGTGRRPQMQEPLSIVFAPDTHASQKVCPSGPMSHSDLATLMKHKQYMCINPIYLKQCNDAELRLLSAQGLLRNSGLQQNQAWLSELSRSQAVAASAAWSQTHRRTPDPPIVTLSASAQAIGSEPHATAAAQVAAPAAADIAVTTASALVNDAVREVSRKPARASSSARADSPGTVPATSAPAASAPEPSAPDASAALACLRNAAAHNVLVSSSELLFGPNLVPELSALPGSHLRPEAHSSNAQGAADVITSGQTADAVPLSTAKESQPQKGSGAGWTAAATAQNDKAPGSPSANADMPSGVAAPPCKGAAPKGTAQSAHESPVAPRPSLVPPKHRSSLTDRQTPASPTSASLPSTAAPSSTPHATPQASLLPSTSPSLPARQSAISAESALAASGLTPAAAATAWTVTRGHTSLYPLGTSQHQLQPQQQLSTTPNALLNTTVMAGGPSKPAEGRDDGNDCAKAQQAASASSEGSGDATEGGRYPFPTHRSAQDRLAGIVSCSPCAEEDSSHLYVFGGRHRTSADQNIPGPSAQAVPVPDLSKPTHGTSPGHGAAVIEAAAIDTSGLSLAPQAAEGKAPEQPEAVAAGTTLASADASEPAATATPVASTAAESQYPEAEEPVAAVSASASQPATAADAGPPAAPLAAATEAAPVISLSSISAASVDDPALMIPTLHRSTQPSLPKKRKKSRYFSETFEVKKRRRNKTQRTKAENRAARAAGVALPSRACAESIWGYSSSWCGDSVSHVSASTQKHTGMLARDSSGRFARLGHQVPTATAGVVTGQQVTAGSASEASEAHTDSGSQDAMPVKQQGGDSSQEDKMQVDQQEGGSIKSERQGQEVACSAPNLMSMLLPKPFVKPIWALDLLMSELEQQGYKSLLEGAFVLVCDRDEQHLVQVKACHPDHNMQPVLTIQNGEEVHFEELSDAVHFEAHHVRLHQVAIITGKLQRLLLDEVAHANMEARIEQSVAYFEVQEQLKQASVDSTTQQTLTEEIRLLTCQIMSRPSDAIYSRIDEDWKTQEEETRSFFVKLCGSQAEEALEEGNQSPSVKQEAATVADTVVPGPHAVTADLVDLMPWDQIQSPRVASSPQLDTALHVEQHDAQAAAALRGDVASPVHQEGLVGVRSRLQSLLQDLPHQDALDAVSAQMPKSPPPAPILSAQGPDTAATAATAADKQPSPGQKLGHALGDPAKAQTDDGLATAAFMPEGQAVPAALVNPSRDIGNFMGSTATAVPGLKKRKRAAAQAAAHATAVDTAAAAAADANNGEPPIEKQKTGIASCWPETVQVVCNGMQGMFDATYTMVTPSTGRRCRPTAFVQSAGMGHVGKWKECIRVDDGEGVPGIAIGHWLKEAKRKGLKRNGGRPLAAKATAASPAGSDALGVAASPDPEASPAGEQQANVQSPASSERATDAEISPNEKAAESQAGVKQTFKHEHKPGVSCLACKEARRQKSMQRQAQLTQDGSTPQGEASPPEGVTDDAKAGKLKGTDGQHKGSSMAVVTEDGQISSVAAEGAAWVPVELGGKPTSPFSKPAAQHHHKQGSGDKATKAPKMVSTAQLHSSSKPIKTGQVSKPSVGRPAKLNPVSDKNSARQGSAATKSAEAAAPGLEAGIDVTVEAGVGTKPGVTLLTKGAEGSLPGVSNPRGSSTLSLAADGGDDEHPGASPSNGLRSPKSPSSPTSPSCKSAGSSRKQTSLAAALSHDSRQTPSRKVASPPNPSSQSVPALSKKVSSPPSPAPASALTSPEKVSSLPNPPAATAAAAAALQTSVTGDALAKAVSPVQEVTAAGKMDLDTGAQPQKKISTKRKRSTEAVAREGVGKRSSANFGGLSLVPLPKAKPSPPEGLLTEEQMDEDQPYWAGRNAPHLPSWPLPFGAAGAGLWGHCHPYMGGSGWQAPSLHSQPGSSGQMISGAGSDAAATPVHAQGQNVGAHATGQGALRSPALGTTQPHETFDELHEPPEPGEGNKAAGGVTHHPRPHPSGQNRQQPREFLRSLGSHEHSQGQHRHIRQPSPQAPGMLTASSHPRHSVGNSERQEGRLSLQTLGSSASQDGSQHPQEPKQHPQSNSRQSQGSVREQSQMQSQGSFSALQSTRQHPPGSNQPPHGSNQHPQPSQLPSRGSHMSQTASGAGSHSHAFGTLRSTPISAQPQSMRVKLSYKWGTHSNVSGVLDLMAHSWSTNRVGRSWAGAGYTDTALNSMLMRSVFMGTLKSEGSLGTSAWQSMLCEWWDGNLVVFTLPREVAANRLQAATASMNLARVVKMLRSGEPLTTSLNIAQAGGHSVCKQHAARLWLTRPRGVTDTLLDMLSREAKASLEEVVPGLLQKRDDTKHSYIIGLITLTGGTV